MAVAVSIILLVDIWYSIFAE